MVGRRLLECSDLSRCIKISFFVSECVGFETQCNSIVDDFKVVWDKAKDAVEATARVTVALLKEAQAATVAVQKAANAAAATAAATLKEVTDAAEKAAATATEFIDDVGNAFSELGKEIQCAAPLPPPAPL